LTSRGSDDADAVRCGLGACGRGGAVLAGAGPPSRDRHDNGAVRAGDREDPERALRDVPRRARTVVSAGDVRAGLAGQAEDQRRSARPAHAAVGRAARVRPLRQRERRHAARIAVHRLVDGRPGTEKCRQGVHQHGGPGRRTAAGGRSGSHRSECVAARPAGSDTRSRGRRRGAWPWRRCRRP